MGKMMAFLEELAAYFFRFERFPARSTVNSYFIVAPSSEMGQIVL
jgi:hypothetical protein